MSELAKNNLSVQEFAKWNRANQVYFDEATKLTKTRLKNILDKGDITPEKKAAQTATAIEREIGKIMAAESKVKPRPRPQERSGNSRGGLSKTGHTDYRKTGLFR